MNGILHGRHNSEIYRMQYEMREEAKADAKRNIERAQDIKELQLMLRFKFIETNELIRKCEEKERNAERTIAVETEKQRQLNRDIEQISEATIQLNEFERKFKRAIDNLKPYEDMLDEVVAESDLFKSKKDVLDRCDALCELLVYICIVCLNCQTLYLFRLLLPLLLLFKYLLKPKWPKTMRSHKN